jgi:hypothetical protein
MICFIDRWACCVGSSIVQFARTPADNRVWAIKYFLSPTAFENESVLYAAHYPELRSQLPIAAADQAAALRRLVQSSGPVQRVGASTKFLPRVELSVGLHGGLMDPKGMPLPPCVVMEKGENLLEWWSHVEQSRQAAQRVRSPPIMSQLHWILAHSSANAEQLLLVHASCNSIFAGS